MTVCVRITALLIRYIKRMRRITLSSVRCLTPHLPILSHTHNNFRKYTENKSGGLIFSTTSSKTFPTQRVERYITKNVYKSVRYTCIVLIKF
jgi:hypothetical protein